MFSRTNRNALALIAFNLNPVQISPIVHFWLRTRFSFEIIISMVGWENFPLKTFLTTLVSALRGRSSPFLKFWYLDLFKNDFKMNFRIHCLHNQSSRGWTGTHKLYETEKKSNKIPKMKPSPKSWVRSRNLSKIQKPSKNPKSLSKSRAKIWKLRNP